MCQRHNTIVTTSIRSPCSLTSTGIRTFGTGNLRIWDLSMYFVLNSYSLEKELLGLSHENFHKIHVDMIFVQEILLEKTT